jgi:hypothetical protein
LWEGFESWEVGLYLKLEGGLRLVEEVFPEVGFGLEEVGFEMLFVGLGGDEDGDETVIGGTEEVSEVRGADCFFL